MATTMGTNNTNDTPATENDSLSEPDDDLPTPFTPVKDNDDFKKGDLLFAQYPKYPYWPGVFYRYIKKRKCTSKQKAYVYFFDELSKLLYNNNSTKKIIPVSVKKLKRFTCKERDEIITVGSDHKIFLNGMEQADEYMRKRALGKMTSFFEFVVEEHDSTNRDGGDMREHENKVQILHDIPQEDIMEKVKIYRKSLFEVDKGNTTVTKNVILWIKENSRSLLRDIMTGKKSSERHEIFINGKQKDKDKLRWRSGFGELNETSANEIFDLLISWFTEDFQGSKYNAITYVSDVWLPEAYIHALSQTKNILLQDAEREYLK